MYVTEEDARNSWCPFARQIHHASLAGVVHPPHNRSDQGWETCCASKCMLWRWKAELGTGLGYCGGGTVPIDPVAATLSS